MLKKRFLISLVLIVAVLVVNLAMIQAEDQGDLTFTPNANGDSYIVSGCKKTITGELSIPATYNGKPVVEIGREAFLGCSGLTSVTIPDSIKTIGWYAFSGCTGLTTVEIPDSVTALDWFAFSGCTGLTSVTVGNGVTCIDASAFAGCTKLVTATLGKSVTTIDWSAFKGCNKLSSINIPGSVTTIERYAFYGCDALSSVTFCGNEDQWTALTKGEGNEVLDNVTVNFHNYVNGICSVCQHGNFVTGDVNGDNVIDHNDAIHLLLNTMFGEAFYPLNAAPGDIDRNGTVDQDDAVYLLLYTMFGENFYPLN